MSVCDLPVVAAVCQVAGDGATTLLASGFAWLADSVSNLAGFMFQALWAVFEATTYVDITSGQFTKVYNILFGVAVFVMLGFFLIQVIGGMIRREPAALSRAALGLAKSVLGSFVALALIATALEITDQLCLGVVRAAGTTMAEMGDRLTLLTASIAVGVTGGPGVTILLTLFVGALAIGAAFIVWITLLVRKALLLIAIVFAPIALAGASWDATRGWVARWAQTVVALIVSKLVMVVFLLLATEQVATPISSDLTSIADPIAGVVLLLVAGFAPYLTYKAISFMGIDFHHAASSEQEAKQALNRPLPLPANPLRRTPPRVLDAASSDGGQHNAAGPVPPPRSVRPPRGGPTPGPGAGGGAGAGGSNAGSAGAASGGAAAAVGAGAVIAGAAVVVGKEVGAAGPRVGRAVAGQTGQQADATEK